MEKKKEKNLKKDSEKKDKKVNILLKIILAILSLILIIVIAYEIVIQFDGFLNTDNQMSREEVIQLLEKGKQYPNYYYSPKNTGILGMFEKGKTEYYIKDGIVNCLYNGKTLFWYDLREEDNQNNQARFDYSLISDKEHFDFDFKYLGEKEIKGRKYILVKVWDKNTSDIICSKFLIDKETGLITQRSDYGFLGILLIRITYDRNIQLDIVTDKDVEKPEYLNTYEDI